MRTANDYLAEARRLAGEYGFRIVDVQAYRNPSSILDKQPYTAYVLYYKRMRLGRRADAAALLRFIRSEIDALKLRPGLNP